MQSLKIATGQRQEGKTSELLFTYLKLNLSDVTYKNGDIESKYKLRDTSSIVYIDCVSNRQTFQDNVERIITENFTAEEAEELRSDFYKKSYHIDNYGALEMVIEKEIANKDCIFLIDSFDNIKVTAQQLLNLIERYPNENVNYSFDIYATKNKEIDPNLKWSVILSGGDRHRESDFDKILDFVEANNLDKLTTKIYLETKPDEYITVPNPFGLYKRVKNEWVLNN